MTYTESSRPDSVVVGGGDPAGMQVAHGPPGKDAGVDRPPDLRTGDDGRQRCGWCGPDPLYVNYHDHEWGRPLYDERALFELTCLEAFQSGLSWLLILRKRQGFRAAFSDFVPEIVADFDDGEVARLLSDPSIVRNRAKIEATVANARAVIAMHDQGESLVDLVHAHTPPADERPSARFTSLGDVPSATPASKALAKALRSRGFRFVGPVVAYSLMQAAGVVDDHLAGCWVADATSPS